MTPIPAYAPLSVELAGAALSVPSKYHLPVDGIKNVDGAALHAEGPLYSRFPFDSVPPEVANGFRVA